MTSAVLSLAGVALGGVIGLLITYLSNRVTRQQANDAKEAALRAEYKAAIMAFLEVAQSVEQAAEDRSRSQEGSLPTDVGSRTHQMWYRQKCIELVCSAALNEKTKDYASRMNDACYRDLPANIDILTYLKQCRNPFLAAARHELGIPPIRPPADARAAPEALTFA
jgi:hypothetical protein